MFVISLIVFPDQYQGHVRTLYNKWFFITFIINKDLATSKQKRNRFEIPLLVAVLRTKFPKEQILVHKNYKPMCNSEQSSN